MKGTLPIDNEIAALPLAGSRASSLIFILLLAIPFVLAVLYGGVDYPMIGVLAAATALIGILWASTAWGTDQLVFSRDPLQLPLIGIVLVGFVQLLPLGGPQLPPELAQMSPTAALSFDPFATRMFLVRLIASLIFFAAALTFITGEKRVRRAVVAVVIFGAAMAFFGVLQRLAAPDAIYGLRPTPQAIPFGSFVNQHHFAAFMEMTCGLALGLLFGGVKRDKKPLLGIAAVMMVLAIVFTGSRGGMLSFLATAGFVALASYVYRNRSGSKELEAGIGSRSGKLRLIGGAAVSVALILGLIAFLGAGENLIRGIGLTSGSDPTSGRAHFWWVALQIFWANPILGAGLDAFGASFPHFDTWPGIYRLENAHNDYLQMLADGGLLGFACVATFVFLLVRNGFRAIGEMQDKFERAAAIGAMGGCIGILVHSFFDFPLRTTSNGLFFLLLVVIATRSGTAPGDRTGAGIDRKF